MSKVETRFLSPISLCNMALPRKVSKAVSTTLKELINMIGLGSKTAQSSDDDLNVYMLAMIGQSQMSGAALRSSMTDPVSADYPVFGSIPIVRAYIFDKVKTPGRMSPELTDSNRAGAPFQLRPLRVGYGGDNENLYPWETFAADPYIGPETQLAANWVKHRKGKLVIVKMSKSGTETSFQPYATWNVAQTGANAYTNTFITAYWQQAYTAALSMVGGNPARVKVLGGVSMIGYSDARHPDNYYDDMLAIIDSIRSAMGTVDGSWLVVKSPETINIETGFPDPGLLSIRAQQESLGSETGISVIDSEGLPLGAGDVLHFSADGYNQLGDMMARVVRGF
jgi:lysophospholipase L1-like esterase